MLDLFFFIAFIAFTAICDKKSHRSLDRKKFEKYCKTGNRNDLL